jgi:hypothetical protein
MSLPKQGAVEFAVDGVVAQPHPEQRLVKVLARDRLPWASPLTVMRVPAPGMKSSVMLTLPALQHEDFLWLDFLHRINADDVYPEERVRAHPGPVQHYLQRIRR